VGALPGPNRLGFTSRMGAATASDRTAGLPAEMDCSDWAVAYGMDPMDSMLNLAVPLLFRRRVIA